MTSQTLRYYIIIKIVFTSSYNMIVKVLAQCYNVTGNRGYDSNRRHYPIMTIRVFNSPYDCNTKIFNFTLWHHIIIQSGAWTPFMSAQDKETRLPLTRTRVHTATVPNKTDAAVYRPPKHKNVWHVPREATYLVNPSVIRLLSPLTRNVFDSEPMLWSFPPENTFGSDTV